MQIHKPENLVKGTINNPVATVGIFDGVHKGHQYIIDLLKEQAEKIQGETVIITLWPHPRMVLFPEKEIKLLTSLEEKIELLSGFSIDHVIVIPFDESFAQTGAKEFFDKYLIEKVGIHQLLVGFDNHFGKNKEGNHELVKEQAQKWGVQLIHPAPVFEGRDRISSTDIRLELELGSIAKANKLLGYEYFLTGKVVMGKMLGRTLGYPTANIEIPEYKMAPRVGVYAVKIHIQNQIYFGMLNIGFRPTIEKSLHKSIEVNIFDFSGDLYNTEIRVTFVARLRDEVKFSGIDTLKEQLAKDKENALSILKR